MAISLGSLLTPVFPSRAGPLVEKLVLELSFQDFSCGTLGEFIHDDAFFGHLEGGETGLEKSPDPFRSNGVPRLGHDEGGDTLTPFLVGQPNDRTFFNLRP